MRNRPRSPNVQKAIDHALNHFKPITAAPKNPNFKPFAFHLDTVSILQMKSKRSLSKPCDHNNLISPYIAMGISECLHTNIKTYVGFTESYQYCARCDKKIE